MTYGYTRNKEGQITGEIDRLRYSAFDCWIKSKDSYRKKYYEGRGFSTPETIFGHIMHKKIENGEVVLPGLEMVPNRKREYDIAAEIGPKGHKVKIGGCLDEFHPDLFSFLDDKFGHRNKDGKPPWDAVKVARHVQLVYYSLLVKLKHGKVHPVAKLRWIETVFKNKSVEFAGHTLTTDCRELELTGHFQVFERRITQWERDLLRAKIIKVAKEIEEDFKSYKLK